MEDIGEKIEILRNNEDLKLIWENKAHAFNAIFEYLKKKGLKEKELIRFSVLLRDYLQLI